MIEHDTQDEELELALVRKELSLIESSTVDNGKDFKGEPSPGTNNMEGRQGANQLGESIA